MKRSTASAKALALQPESTAAPAADWDGINFVGLRVNSDWAKLPLFDRTGWQRLPFGAFAENVNERVEPTDAADEIYVGLDDLDPGSLHIRRWGKGSDVIGTKLLFRKGDIIFGRRRAYQRKLAVAEFDGICSAHAMVVRAKPDVVLPEFLPFLMMSDRFMHRAVEISVGSLSPTINWKTLKIEQFDLPPLDQQQHIAHVIDAMNIVLDSHETLERATSRCQEASFRESVEIGRRAYLHEQHAWPYWRQVPLSQVVEFLDGQRRPMKEGDRAKRSGLYPYYGASGVIDSVDDFIFDEPLILLGEDGANILDRSSPLAFRVNGKIWVNNHAHVLRVKPPHSLIYLEYFLESLDYKPYVTGTAQPKLNKAACEKIPVLVPDASYQRDLESDLLSFERALSFESESKQRIRQLLGEFLNEVVRIRS